MVHVREELTFEDEFLKNQSVVSSYSLSMQMKYWTWQGLKSKKQEGTEVLNISKRLKLGKQRIAANVSESIPQ